MPGRPTVLLTCAAVAVASALTVTGVAPAAADQDVVVGEKPLSDVPVVVGAEAQDGDGDNSAEEPQSTNQVLSVATHGDLVAVAGTFTGVRNPGSAAEIDQRWLFVYDRTTGQVLDSFRPTFAGGDDDTGDPDDVVYGTPGVEAVAFAPDGQSVYAAGWFTSVNGTTRQRVARIALDGSVVASFAPSVDFIVKDMALTDDRVVIGGRFHRVNGQPVSTLAALDPTTGATETDFNLPASGSRDPDPVVSDYVQELEVSPDGRWLAVAGNFLQVGAVDREQLALIDLEPTGGGDPEVATWSTDRYGLECYGDYQDSYIRGLSFDPESSYLVVTGTGGLSSDTEALCDVATRWELPPTASGDGLQPTWVSDTGGDTLWAAHVTSAAVYVGGHQRWMNNSEPGPAVWDASLNGDDAGPGSVRRWGIAALDPLTGVPLSWDPEREPRGRGAEAITSDGPYLYVGQDTRNFGPVGDDVQTGMLAVLSTAGGTANPQPEDVDLPVDLRVVTGSTTVERHFDGTTLDAPVDATGGVDWSGFRGGFVQRDELTWFGADDAYYRTPLTGSGYGSTTNLSTSIDYADEDDEEAYPDTPQTRYGQAYGIAETRAAAYLDGYVYYVRDDDDRLLRRGYSLESGILASAEEPAQGRDWSGATALTFVGDWLYAAWDDGALYRFYAPDGAVDYDSRTLVDAAGGATDWAGVDGLYTVPSTGSVDAPAAPDTTCSGTTPWRASYWSNQELVGTADLSRCEEDDASRGGGLVRDWGTSAPDDASVGEDQFSVRWTRTVTIDPADAGRALRADVTADDGVRVYVDGTRIVDEWHFYSDETYTGTSPALAAGEHEVRVEMFEYDGGAGVDLTLSRIDPPTLPLGPDNTPGDTTITSPAAGATTRTNEVTVRGSATDDRAVDRVRVAVLDRDAEGESWLQDDGTFGPEFASRDAALVSPGSTSSTWNIALDLPDGRYGVDAVSYDEAGNVDPTSAYREVTVDTSPPDTADPDTTLRLPRAGQRTGKLVTFTGTATDDTGVERVRVAVLGQGDPRYRWLQRDGGWGKRYAWRAATLADPGATSTTWRLRVRLPAGRYGVDVVADDVAGNYDRTSVYREFRAGRDRVKPKAATRRVAGKRSVRTTLRGVARDNESVRDVRLRIERLGAPRKRRWVQPNGTLGKRAARLRTNLVSPGAGRTAWVVRYKIPRGRYRVRVLAYDAMLNQGSGPAKTFRDRR